MLRYAEKRSYSNPTQIIFDEPPPATVLLCSEDSDMMEVNDVVLIPDPPKRGQNLTVEISGWLKDDLEDGAYMLATVRKSGIKFPQFKLPVCEYLDSRCPVEKGLRTLSMTFEIPGLMPGGGYEIQTILWNVPPVSLSFVDTMMQTMINVATSMMNRVDRNAKKIFFLREDRRVLCVQGSIQL